MPTDYGDSVSLENYIETCANITDLYDDCEAVHLVVAGDFNCRSGSRFHEVFLHFANDNNLCLSDLNRMAGVFTYCSDNASSSSWIDHVLCSPSIDNLINWCDIRYEYVSSDHKPLVLSFTNLYRDAIPVITYDHKEKRTVYDWSGADEHCILMYRSELDEALKTINIPVGSFDVNTFSDYDYGRMP